MKQKRTGVASKLANDKATLSIRSSNLSLMWSSFSWDERSPGWTIGVPGLEMAAVAASHA